MKKHTIALVGATGLVGREVLKILNQYNLAQHKYVLFASSSSQGKTLKLGNKSLKVMTLSFANLDKYNFDYALFCVGEDISKQYVNYLANRGTKVIDFSSAFRHQYPLIVPEINFGDVKGNIICNPNCSTIAGVVALNKINEQFGLKRIIYSTYQAVSGAGKLALNDLKNKTAPQKLDYPIHNNLIPYIGAIAHNGYSKEECKMIFESKKILHLTNTKITATCVRVPVDIGHSESINFQTIKSATCEQIVETLKQTLGIKVVDTPMPIDVKGQDCVLVGRVRKDEYGTKTFNMFVVSDNLRKGAAQNGVQILERLINEDGL